MKKKVLKAVKNPRSSYFKQKKSNNLFQETDKRFIDARNKLLNEMELYLQLAEQLQYNGN